MYHPKNPYRGSTAQEQISLRYTVRTPEQQVKLFLDWIGGLENVKEIKETNESFEFKIKKYEDTQFDEWTKYVEEHEENKEPVDYRAISGCFVMHLSDDKKVVDAVSCAGEINDVLRKVMNDFKPEVLNGERAK